MLVTIWMLDIDVLDILLALCWIVRDILPVLCVCDPYGVVLHVSDYYEVVLSVFDDYGAVSCVWDIVRYLESINVGCISYYVKKM